MATQPDGRGKENDRLPMANSPAFFSSEIAELLKSEGFMREPISNF